MLETIRTISIFAPLTGKVIDLAEVPDKMYSKRMLGDGVAIIPEDGVVYSPVNGYITVIAEDNHAYGFVTDDGLEILVHIGIESKDFTDLVRVHQKVNSRVQAGDMVAEFDLEKLQAAGINMITPVIICGGLEGKTMKPTSGHVQAGAGEILTIEDVREVEPPAPAETEAKAEASEPKSENAAAAKNNSELRDFLADSSNWPKLIGGLVGLTLVLVVIFVSMAMMLGH